VLKLHQSSRLISRALLLATLLGWTITPRAAAAPTGVTPAQVAAPAAMVIPAPVAISIPMRDGVRLGADLYLPAGKKPFPVLLSITPYAKAAMRRSIRGTWMAGGYAVVIVDSRGLGSSGGKWQPYINEGRDGYDVQQWIGRQSWCNGKIGMFGVSYPAYTQVAPAPYRSKYVEAIVPVSAQSDNYGSVWLTDGILHLAFGPRWAESEQAVADKREMPPIDWVKVAWTLPLGAIPSMLPIKSPFIVDVIQNEAYDAFWRAMSVRQKYSQMDVPALHVTGWYDDLSNETQLNFIGMSHSSRSQRSRRLQHLLIGPWGHGVPKFPQGDWVYGDIDFGTAPKIDFDAMEQRWFDFFLKGIKNGVDQEAPVRVFAMGANVWRNYQQWPPARAVSTSYYFHSEGFANTRFGNGTLNTTAPGTEPPDHYRYDPRNPVPTHGGHGCCDYQFSSIGPFDQSVIEQRPDTLVYTTAPLEKDVEIAGFPQVHLAFSTDVRDTDFFVTVSDVFPDGRSILITDGEARTRFRHSMERPQLLTPNKLVSITVRLWGTSNVFKEGHRIRVRITSSNFPRFARNLNSGKRAAEETAADIRVATQTIFHAAGRASSIVLPIIQAANTGRQRPSKGLTAISAARSRRLERQ
jgi:hypothetical protein